MSSEEPKPICERIGHKLCKLRVEAGFTLTDLSERTELSRAYLSELERGKCEPGAGTIVRLCRVLRISADELLGVAQQ